MAVNDGERSFSARLDWKHEPENDTILVSTPFGQTLASLRRDAEGAWLDTADDRSFRAADVESLSAQVFGHRLPLAAMPRWVLGARADGGVVQARDTLGRAKLIVERDWRVEYAQYESDAAEALPQLLRISRGQLEVRLRIDRWELPE